MHICISRDSVVLATNSRKNQNSISLPVALSQLILFVIPPESEKDVFGERLCDAKVI